MKIVLLGAPGCGKGTQAPMIAEEFIIPHISTGAIFRNALAEKTELGILAKQFMDKGELVPDEVTIGLVRDRLSRSDCKKGFILDGFPRTVYQAEQLDKFSDVEYCIYFSIDENTLINRITGRRVCEKCGATYHISSYNKTTCEKCGSAIIQRADDTVETLKKRMSVYNAQTQPLIDYYAKNGTLKTINADQPVDVVSKQIKDLLKA